MMCRVGLLHVGKSPPAILYQMGHPRWRKHMWEDKQKAQLLAQPYSGVTTMQKGVGILRNLHKHLKLAGACLLLHPLLSNCIFSPTATRVLLMRRVLEHDPTHHSLWGTTYTQGDPVEYCALGL